MTVEPPKLTEPWIKSKGVTYAYGYDKSGKLDRFFNVSGIPHAVLIDPTGKIVWTGHPGNLNDGVIEKALDGSLTKPMWEWPASAKAVRTAVQKKQWGEAVQAASKLSEADSGPTIVAALTNLVGNRVKAAQAAYEAGNFLGAQTSANELAKSIGSLPAKADVDKLLADLKANKDAARVTTGQTKIRAIREAGLTKPKDLDKAIDDLAKIAKEYAGTYAATEANELLENLKAAKRGK